MVDKLKRVVDNLDLLDKKKNKLLRKVLQPIAEDFNNEVVWWLKTKNYPLRMGGLSPQPAHTRDEWDGRTATERLHGEQTLAAAQYVRLRKKRGEDSLEISFYNAAPQAQYFFPGTKAHRIRGNPKLIYWAGDPLAWHPPIDMVNSEMDDELIPGGIRRRPYVNHPGHEAFEEYVFTKWQRRGYRKRMKEAYAEVVEGLIKSAREGL